jgi:hypothetical protein
VVGLVVVVVEGGGGGGAGRELHLTNVIFTSSRYCPAGMRVPYSGPR